MRAKRLNQPREGGLEPTDASRSINHLAILRLVITGHLAAPFHDEEPALVGGPVDQRDLLHHDVAQAVYARIAIGGCLPRGAAFVCHGSSERKKPRQDGRSVPGLEVLQRPLVSGGCANRMELP